MQRFAIILNNELVHKYESDNQLLFGGPWGAEDAVHIEYNSDWKHIKYIDKKIMQDVEKTQVETQIKEAYEVKKLEKKNIKLELKAVNDIKKLKLEELAEIVEKILKLLDL